LAVLEPRTIVLIIKGPIERDHIPCLCERAVALVEGSEARHVICDVGALVDPDVVAIDALARLQLTVRRLGCRIRVRHACEDLQDLLTLTGLSHIIAPCPESGVDPGREVESGEEPRGVEEETDPGDLTR
jgi:ABC-type transporter Mla MlaB component